MFEKVVVTGSLAYDHIMSMPGSFKDHIMPDKLHILNVSFIMDTFRQEFGGTGGNIVYNLGLLETPTALVASAGKDFGSYKKHLRKINSIDLKGVRIFKKFNTARGFVITDRDDNQIWGFYEGAMSTSSRMSLSKYLKKKSLLIVAPNDPVAMIKYVDQAIGSKIPYIFDPAFNIAHFKLNDIKRAIKHSHILIGNDYEITLIKRKLNFSQKDLLAYCNLVITTLGAGGSIIENKDDKIIIPSAKPENKSDPTGAGDAYRAGFVAGYFRGFSLETCGKMGALTAVYTVEKYGTQTHNFSLRQFCGRYKENFGERIILRGFD